MAKKDQKSQEKKVLTEWGGWITWGQEFETILMGAFILS